MSQTLEPNDVTRLLVEWQNGDPAALDRLMPLVYSELRGIAKRYLSRESPAHTLQSTALVHEAYFKLVGQRRVRWQNRAQFFAIAAQMMRRILVDHARRDRPACGPHRRAALLQRIDDRGDGGGAAPLDGDRQARMERRARVAVSGNASGEELIGVSALLYRAAFRRREKARRPRNAASIC